MRAESMIRTMHGVLYSETMPRGGPEALMGMEEENYAAVERGILESTARELRALRNTFNEVLFGSGSIPEVLEVYEDVMRECQNKGHTCIINCFEQKAGITLRAFDAF
jgi:hypothetical protein